VISYDLTVDEEKLGDALELFKFVGGNTWRAMTVAINRAAPRVKTLVSTKIRGEVRLTAAYVRERLEIRKAYRGNLNGAVTAPSRGLLLAKFSTDPLISRDDKVSWIKAPSTPPGGIKVKVKPSGLAKLVPEVNGNKPFYILLKGGNLGIAARSGGIGPGGGKLEVFYGPSLSQVFGTIRQEALPEASAIYQEELISAMNYVLKKEYPPEESII
jgi:hypothetical protein